MLVSRPTHGGGAPLGIDLEAGVATIVVRRPAPPQTPADEPIDGPDDQAAPESQDGADASDPTSS